MRDSLRRLQRDNACRRRREESLQRETPYVVSYNALGDDVRGHCNERLLTSSPAMLCGGL
jgi:hypothetical protein